MNFAGPLAVCALLFLFAAFLPSTATFSGQVLVRQDEEYSYDPRAANGPSNWADISPEFADCDGDSQSPIDFPCLRDPSVGLLSHYYGPHVQTATSVYSFSVSPSNWNLDCVSPGECGSATYAGTTYNTINLHFHSDSEHTIHGVQYPLEAHIVHQATDGSFLVIGILFDDGGRGDCLTSMPSRRGRNSAFEEILVNVERNVTQFTVDTGAFLEIGRYMDYSVSFCTYAGSLTTPPCTETVQWFLAGRRQNINRSQTKRYRRTADAVRFGNNRPTQPRNSRPITCFLC